MIIDRITADPALFGGRPCIRGLRFPVAQLLGLLAAGETTGTMRRSFFTTGALDPS